MDLNVQCKTIKLLGKNQENLQDLCLGKEFLTLKAQFLKRKIDKLDPHQN